MCNCCADMHSSAQDMVKDVVCGMEKPREMMGFSSKHKGAIYYFCSKMDKEMFDAHPDRWAKTDGEKNER